MISKDLSLQSMIHGHDIDLTSASQWRPFEHAHDGTVIIKKKKKRKKKKIKQIKQHNAPQEKKC